MEGKAKVYKMSWVTAKVIFGHLTHSGGASAAVEPLAICDEKSAHSIARNMSKKHHMVVVGEQGIVCYNNGVATLL